MAQQVIPLIDPIAGLFGTPLVDPKTGMVTEPWMRWFIQEDRVRFGQWNDILYDPANFTTNIPAFSWTVAAADVQRFQTFQLGEWAAIIVEILASSLSNDVDTLYLRIPTLKVKNTGVSIASAVKTFLYAVGGVYTVGVADVNNITGASDCRLELMQLAGTDFLAVNSYAIFVVIFFPCQPVAVR